MKLDERASRRILLCHNYYREPGGESSVFDTEVEGLGRAGHQVSIYRRENTEIDTMGLLRRAALFPQAFNASRTRRDIEALVRRERPDVAIVQNVFPLMSPSLYSALQAHGVPVIQAVYNYRLICPNASLFTNGEICERCVGGNYFNSVLRRCYRDNRLLSGWYAAILWSHRVLRTFVERIDRFMVPDQFLGDKLVAGGIPRKKIRVNPNPFLVEKYTPVNTHRGTIVFVGRLVRQKGILTLLEAMRRDVAQATLVVVGQGDLEGAVRAFIRSHQLEQRVLFKGPLWGDAMREVMAGAKAVVVPSEWYDNLPQIVCQANAMGKPVIASRINGIPEYVHDGENGLLFEPGNVDELARSIKRIADLSDAEYATWSRRSRVVAENGFDFAVHHRILMDTIDEIYEESRR